MGFLFAEKTRTELIALANDQTIVIVPLGSTEQHALHLPVGTDNVLVENVVHQAAAKAFAKGVSVLVTPTLPLGYAHHHIPFGGTMSISQDTLVRVLVDLGGSLAQQGYRRIFFVNGHGGNTLATAMAVTDLTTANKQCLFAGGEYWNQAREKVMADRASEPGGMGHAGEFETSLFLAFAPGLAEMDKAEPAVPKPRIPGELNDLLQKGPVAIGRDWKTVTTTGAMGDPTLATKEKGVRWAGWLADALCETIENISKIPLPPVEN